MRDEPEFLRQARVNGLVVESRGVNLKSLLASPALAAKTTPIVGYSVVDPRSIPDISERQFQEIFVATARMLGWTVFHDNDSRGNEEGLLDNVCWRPVGKLRFFLAELKVGDGEMTPAQAE